MINVYCNGTQILEGFVRPKCRMVNKKYKFITVEVKDHNLNNKNFENKYNSVTIDIVILWKMEKIYVLSTRPPLIIRELIFILF